MRTTIDLTDEQRARLLAVAARRGLRGYSLLIQEALAEYLKLPAPKPRPAGERSHPKKRKDLLSFLSDGFSTGRKEGSSRHDEYIYRGK